MTTQTIKTAYDLKYAVQNTGSNFFDRSSMKFFGDTMANYGVRSKPVIIKNHQDESIECYELYRKRAVKHGLDTSAFFNVLTFERVLPTK